MKCRLAFAVWAFGFAIAAQAQSLPSPEKVWAKSRSEGLRVPLRATLTVTVWNEQGKTTTRSQIVRDDKGRHRRSYPTPGNSQRRYVIQDGTFRWQYEPAKKTVFQSPFSTDHTSLEPEEHPLDLVQYRLALAPKTAQISGRQCYVLSIVPKIQGIGSQTRWIDTKTYFTLQSETRYSDRSLVSRVNYSQVQLPAKTRPSEFQPALKNVKVVKLPLGESKQSMTEMTQLAKEHGLPIVRPMGFQLRRVVVNQQKASRVTQFLYSDGLFFLSIFVEDGYAVPTESRPPWKTVQLDSVTLYELKRPYNNVIVWSQAGKRYSLMSRISPQALHEFVRAVTL